MPIETVQVKQPKYEKVYKCDILFKEIRQDQVACQIDRWVISKEGWDRLPKDFHRKNLLRRLIYANGHEKGGFTPELLYKGVWVLVYDPEKYQGSWLTNKSYDWWHAEGKQFEANPKVDFSDRKRYYLLNSVEVATKFATSYKNHNKWFYIFENGKLVREIKTKHEVINHGT